MNKSVHPRKKKDAHEALCVCTQPRGLPSRGPELALHAIPSREEPEDVSNAILTLPTKARVTGIASHLHIYGNYVC